MAAASPPENLKQINSFLKLAKEYDKRDQTVAYFCRMFAVQNGIEVDSKSTESKRFLFGLMDQLEQTKKLRAESGDEAVSNDIVAQAHMESATLNLFSWADKEDRNAVFNRNITKAFYSASLLFEVMNQFGELSEECKVKQKYAKWKATYLHRCLRNGEKPIPGPEGSEFESELNSLGPSNSTPYPPDNTPANTSAYPPNNSFAGPGSSNYPPSQQNFPNVPPPQQNFPSVPPAQPDFPNVPTQPGRPVPAPRRPSEPHVEPPRSHGEEIDFTQASKLCKYAISAMQYEDVPTAVLNLEKALTMLKNK